MLKMAEPSKSSCGLILFRTLECENLCCFWVVQWDPLENNENVFAGKKHKFLGRLDQLLTISSCSSRWPKCFFGLRYYPFTAICSVWGICLLLCVTTLLLNKLLNKLFLKVGFLLSHEQASWWTLIQRLSQSHLRSSKALDFF